MCATSVQGRNCSVAGKTYERYTVPVHGVGSEVQGGSVLAHWPRRAEFATLSRLSASEPNTRARGSQWGQESCSSCKARMTCSSPGPQQGESHFQSCFPTWCWLFKYWWGTVCLSVAWTRCHRLGHGPKALLAICCGWAYGHRASALSQRCMFPARRIERKDETCHH